MNTPTRFEAMHRLSLHLNLIFAAALLLSTRSILPAQQTLYFAHQQANIYSPTNGDTGGTAPTSGGNVGDYQDPGLVGAVPQPIQSADGALVLQQSALGASVVAFPEGMVDGYSFYVGLGNSATAAGTTYKQDQNGSTVPWDLRFPGVVQLNEGTQWPNCTNCNQSPNFDESRLREAAEHFRVAIRANPYDLQARTGLITTYRERMLAHIFAGNNAAQYASGHRLAGGTINEEIGYWQNAITQYQAAGNIFAEATGLLPDAATFESPEYAGFVKDALDIFARGLAYESDATRYWLQLSYFATYHDPLSQTYNPDALLASLQPKLDHLQSLLLLASQFTHVPNYLELDFPSVNASLAFLNKQKNTSIPLGMVSFVGQRAAGNAGEVIGEYAPEYVPFLFKDDASSLPTSFENLLKEATDLITVSEGADAIARNAVRTFDTDRAQLTARLDEIFGNYNTQLGDLCGWIYGSDNLLHADVLGSLLPPGDREEVRPFQNGESPGKIYQQYLAVNQTLLEVEAAEQDRHNIYLKAVNAKTVGELIANQSANLAQMYLTDGASLAALEKLRGAEAARITREIARQQAEEAERQASRGLLNNVLKGVAVVGTAVLTVACPPAGAAVAAVWIAGAASATYNTWSEYANAHGNIALILKTGDLQAQLAEITADIEAQKEVIRSSEAATVQFAQRDATLWKTEEAWQAAILDYERAALNVLMAKQRLLMQKAELANLHTRVSFLLQEMRKAIVLNTQTINPLARPDYRLWMDYVNRYAEDSFLRAQEWLYLSAKAAQYKVNSSSSVTDISGRIEATLRARRGADLRTIRDQLSTDVNTLYLAQGTPTTALPIPLRLRNYVVQNNSVIYGAQGDVDTNLSLFETQLSGTNTLAASDAAWLAFLQDHIIIDLETFSVRLEIPFSTSLHRPNITPGPGFDALKVRQNPLFSPTRYSDLISYTPGSGSAFGVRVNIRGRNLNLDSSQSVVARLRQEGASYLRTQMWNSNPQAFRVWNLRPVEGLIPCSINSVGAASLSTPQFHERSAANDHWILVIDILEGAGGNNAALLSQLQNITDIEITFSIKGFTN
jgi:hypothetical protein